MENDMPALVTQPNLRAHIEAKEWITNADLNAAEGVKYDFRMGSQFLKAAFGRPMNFDELHGTDKAKAKIDPGEVVFVLSEELVKLPSDVMVILSHKRKISHDGIAVMGGFCIDPGYEGYLLIGLYNFSSEPFVLQPGRKLIAGLFYKLNDGEAAAFAKPTPILTFPDDLVRMIKSYQPINLSYINETITSLSNELHALKVDLRDDRKWREDIKSTIDKLVAGLDKEIQAREGQFRDVQDKFEKTSDKISNIDAKNAESRGAKSIIEKLLFIIVGVAISSIAGAIFAYLKGWIKFSS